MRGLTKEELNSILADHKFWLKSGCTKGKQANLCEADLCKADLCGANLRGADLRGADLCGAGIDFSCLPLWCGSLSAHFDDRQLRQIAYHLVKAGLQSKNASL